MSKSTNTVAYFDWKTVIKSPKQRLETYCFCSVSYYYYYYYSLSFFLSVDHELDIEKFITVVIFKMAAKIQHCPISSKFDMWVDYDVPNLFPTLKNF